MPRKWPLTKAALLYTVLLGNVLLATREYEDYRASYREPPQWVADASHAADSVRLAAIGEISWGGAYQDVELAMVNLIRWCLGKPPFREWV